jgi:short-subunit dehydrogenase
MNFVEKNGYAVVTGAASGLGRSYSVELSRLHINTILVDLPEKGLFSHCCHLRDQFDVDSVCFEFDLREKAKIIEFARIVNSRYPVFMLINNAGIGGSKRFEKVDVEYIYSMIQLNVMAPMVLTHQLLPNLQKQQSGFILNVASLAAFCPMAFKTAYPASKVFIYYLSRGLCQELRDKKIFVSVVVPGPMRTCLLYTSDAADDSLRVVLGGRGLR